MCVEQCRIPSGRRCGVSKRVYLWSVNNVNCVGGDRSICNFQQLAQSVLLVTVDPCSFNVFYSFWIR